MSAEIAPLGFDIDTSALVQGAKAADQLANALGNVANATDKVDNKSAEAAAEIKKVAEAEKQAAMSAEEFAKTVVHAVTALTKEQEAAKRAAEETRKKAEADKKAAEAAKKAAEEEARRATVLGRVSESLRGMQGAAANSNHHIENLAGQFGRIAGTVNGGPGGISGGISTVSSMFARFATSLGPIGGLVAGVGGGIVALGGSFMGLAAATAPVQERFALLEARLKNVYGSADTAKRVFADITLLASKNAVAIDQTAEAYLRLARNNSAIGLSRREMVQLTDTVQMLGRVSGATTGELASGMMQFSQALASGRLNGDELRSIMENMPALAKAIADGMKISVGQLRAMGAEGQLTGDKITKALLGQTEKIQKEFEGLPQTSEQAFTRVGNAWDLMLERIGKKINSTGVLQWVAKAAEDIIKATDTAISGETSNQAIDRNRAIMNSPNWDQATRDAAARELRNQQYQAWSAGQEARAQAERNLIDETKRVPNARFEAAKNMIGEIDPVRKRVQELTANLTTLQTIWNDYQRNPSLFPREAEAQLKLFPGYIAKITAELQNALGPLEKFQKGTSDKIADAIRYGYSSTFGADVRRLTDQGVSQSAAVGAVNNERIFSLNAETDSINRQIEAEQKRTAAIGQGRDAEREAEASAKALEYQLRNFGITLDAGARASVDAYKASLLALSAAQDAAANKQAMLTAQIDLAAAKAGAAAAAAGGGPGAVAEAQRNARRAGQLATSDDPASMAVRFAAEDIDRQTGEVAQLRRVRNDAAMQRRIAGGMSPAAARRAQQDMEARQFSEGFSSAGAREVAYQEKLNELRARDAANGRKRIDERQQALDMLEKETELTKTGSLEERVAIARAREMTAIRQEGVELSKEELDLRLQIAESEVRAKDRQEKAQEAANRYKQTWDDIGQAVASNLDSAFSKMLDGQKVKFKEFAQDLMKDLAMILLRNYITGALSRNISTAGQSLFSSAHGNVFAGGHLTMYGVGGVVGGPTIFPMARGAGLMGEAGPEAVLPLKRGPDGRLGVSSGGGASNDNGVQVVVNDMRSGGERVETQEERGTDGKRMIRLTIRDEVKSQMKNGSFDPEMQSQYGARRMLVRR